MEINIFIVLALLFTHWVNDFTVQTDEEAKGKSVSNYWLFSHTIRYSIFFFCPCIILFDAVDPEFNMLACVIKSLTFVCITFILHTFTDYYTSRLNSKLWKEGRRHDFFVSIGFDQFLHYLQLILTFQILS